MSTKHSTLTGADLHYSKIKTASGNPNSNSFASASGSTIGDVYLDTDTRIMYVRKFFTGVNDWVTITPSVSDVGTAQIIDGSVTNVKLATASSIGNTPDNVVIRDGTGRINANFTTSRSMILNGPTNAGDAYLALATQTVNPTATAGFGNLFATNSGNSLAWGTPTKGVMTFDFSNAAVGRNYIFPNVSGGTIITSNDLGTVTAGMLSAGIPYSLLNLTGKIKSADLEGNIAVNKLVALNTNSVVVTNGSGYLSTYGSLDLVNLQYLQNTNSNIQIQLNNKQDIAGGGSNYITGFTGAISSVASGNPQVPSTIINAGQVTDTALATSSVITSKILDLNVTTAKIADGAVTNAKISGVLDNAKTTATSANIGDKIVSRDGSGNFAASDVSLKSIALNGTLNIGESFIEMRGQTIEPSTPAASKGRLFAGDGSGGVARALAFKTPGGFAGYIDFSNITTSTKIFTLPNVTGNLVVDSAAQSLSNKSIDTDGLRFINTVTTPSSPSAGTLKLYNKGGVFYSLTPGGTETTIGGNAITALTGDVLATGPGSANATIADGAITTIKLFGGIPLSKLATVSNSKIITSNISGVVGASAYSSDLLDNITGVSSNIQTQLNNITAVGITGLSGAITATGPGVANTIITVGAVGTSELAGNIPDSKLAIINTSGKVTNLAVGATSANTGNAIVARDINGSFIANVGNFTSVVSTSVSATNSTINNASSVANYVSGYTDAQEGTAPATPSAGKLRVYAKTDSKLYMKNSAGTEVELGGGGGGITALTGDVTASGTGSVAATIGTSKVTDAMLAGSIPDTKLLTIATTGKVSNSATTATSVNTANKIVSRDAGGNFAASQGTFTDVVTGTVGATTTTSTNVLSSQMKVDNYTDMGLISTPSNPTAGSLRVYAKSDKKLYVKDSGGGEFVVGSGGITTLTGDIDATGSGSVSASIGTGKVVNTMLATATASNTGNYVVLRDGVGSFASNVISASVFKVTATGGAGYIDLPSQSTLPSTPPTATGRLFAGDPYGGGAGRTLYYGNPSGIYAGLEFLALSGNRIYTFPDLAGIIALTTGAQTFNGKTFSDAITLTQIATPTAPGAGFTKLYTKSDNKIYRISSSGGELEVGGGSGITALTGEVTASGTGSVAATIVNNAITDAKLSTSGAIGKVLTATSANTASTLVLRDGSGDYNANQLNANRLSVGNTTSGQGYINVYSQSTDVASGPTGIGRIWAKNSGRTFVFTKDTTGNAELNFSGLSANRIFTFPDLAGTFVLDTDATSANTANKIVKRDAFGDFNSRAQSVERIFVTGVTNTGDGYISLSTQTNNPSSAVGRMQLYTYDDAKTLKMMLGTGFHSNLYFPITDNRLYTFPNASGNVVLDSASQTLSNKSFSDEITLTQITTPSTPSAGNTKVYPKADGSLYKLDSAGVETQIGAGGGGGGPEFGTLAVRAVSAWSTKPTPTTNQWKSICWSPALGLFCAVALTGTGNRVMTSPDGTTWTIRASAADNQWNSVCWSPELGIFCAVAQSGTGNQVMTSNDGINWISRVNSVDIGWQVVCWSPELGLFAALAYSGTTLMTSPDGITWTSRTSAANSQWSGLCWSPELSLFVAVATGGGSGQVMTSSNGTTWTARTSASTNQWTSVCWSSGLQQFVAVAQTGTGNRVMTSVDGISWTSRTSAANNQWTAVCWAPGLGVYVAVADTGTGTRVMTSSDGTTWATRTSASDTAWKSVCWSPELGIFVSITNSASFVMASRDVGVGKDKDLLVYDKTFGNTYAASPDKNMVKIGGPKFGTLAARAVSTWATKTTPVDNAWVDICWAPSLSMFAAISYSGAGNRVMTSNDGIAWTARASSIDNQWLTICWSPELGMFAAASLNGTGTRVMTSYDGINWTTRTSAADNSWYCICWSPELGLFCAVASTGTGNRVMTSPDGIVWTSRTSAVDNNWTAVCWSPELGIFAAVSQTGTGNRVMTSPDGIVWTSRTSATDNNWQTIGWSPELGLFCAVSNSGTGNRVMTSSNGITWTSRTNAADVSWSAVKWAAELGLFVAVASSGTGNRIMSSSDGINWTSQTNSVDNQWRSITWAPELGVFAGVSVDGTGNRAMTSKDVGVRLPRQIGPNILGRTDGSVPGTGYVGEVLYSATLIAVNVNTSNGIFTAQSLSTLPNGIYMISGSVTYFRNGATYTDSGSANASIEGTTSGGSVDGINNISENPALSVGTSYTKKVTYIPAFWCRVVSGVYYLANGASIGSGNLLLLGVTGTFSAGTPTRKSYLQAVRIA